MVATARTEGASRVHPALRPSQKIEVTMSTERQLGEVRFLTVAEVATIMRVSKMTVYRMVHAGELPAIRVGRSFRVPEDEVHAYLRSSFVDTA
jgi:excisionase family DNA binding protein